MTVIRTDWRAVNARGRTVHTFSDRDLGRAWVRNNAALHDGLRLESVELIEVARTDYRPRLAKPARRQPDPFAIPAMTASA